MSFAVNPPRAAAPSARTLLSVFHETVAGCGSRVAIDAGDHVLTYAQLSHTTEILAQRLRALGVGPGDRVGVRVPSGTTELYTAILGVLMSGAAYVPVDFDDPPGRADDLLTVAGTCAVVGPRLEIEPRGAARGARRPPGSSDDAWIIFTSGSSGAPKGVAVSHGSAAAFVEAEARLWEVGPQDRVLAGLSVAFDASCEEIWLAWAHGAALVPAPRAVVRAGAELGPWLNDRGVTVLSTVPTLAAMLEPEALGSVRLLILGGEACPESLAWRLAADREVWNTYGPTEATVVSTAARLWPGEPVTIGSPLHGWEIGVVDEDGDPVGNGEPGELVIAGAGVARYLDPLLDTERFPPVPALGFDRAYPTGDIVRETADGLQFIGRRDHQVKIGGRRIELGEIDARLSEVPGVRAAVTVVRESATGVPRLVGYVTGSVDPGQVRSALTDRLPASLLPTVAVLDALPVGRSGKVDRAALPWPLPAPGGTRETAALRGTTAWLAERWEQELGVDELGPDSDFFALGGSSLSAAKLTSVLRERFPAVAVADIYTHRRLGELSDRLDQLGTGDGSPRAGAQPPTLGTRRRWWGTIQLLGVLILLAFEAPQWVIGSLALAHWSSVPAGPIVGWVWLAAGWLALVSAPGRALIVIGARRLLLGDLRPGRYPRHGWLSLRLWFVQRLAEASHLEALAGTPWAARYARLSGHQIGTGARLGTLPPPTSLVIVGDGATLEPDVDLHGWWIDGTQLVVGELRIGARASVGTRSLLMPGASIGERAEVSAGTLISSHVPAGERWAGSPGRRIGSAGDGWPQDRAGTDRPRRRLRALYTAGLGLQTLLPLLGAMPGLGLFLLLGPSHASAQSALASLLMLAPLEVLSFVITYGLLVALAVRAVSPLIRAGWHRDDDVVGWALWFSEGVMASARGLLFPLYATIFTRPWLRLAGIRVGRRTEISTAVGLTHLTRFGEQSFATDDVVMSCAQARGGWLYVAPIEVGDRSFLGNSAILNPATRLGHDSLVGALSTAPHCAVDGTSWFGSPPLELPRIRVTGDPSRTTSPPRRLILGRGAVELVRILIPGTVSTVLAVGLFWALGAVGAAAGLGAALVLAPLLLAATGLLAGLATVAVKWGLMGRYAPGEHPLWSSFVWRDEIVNSCQEQLAGAWLLRVALATPLIPVFLRLMGARVGCDVWCESLNLTELDTVTLGDGCVINRHAVVETHLFHDRQMRIGPATIGAGATLGPATAILPDTTIGAGCRVGGRSVVMRGERLAAGTHWHGAPVVADA